MDNKDKELKAMGSIVESLSELSEEEKYRVLEYAIKRFGVKLTGAASEIPFASESPIYHNLLSAESADAKNENPLYQTAGTMDIRKLTEQKSPITAVQMAVLVAYYLSDLAGPEEKADSIGAEDIEKYFKQANYPLPKRIAVLLNDAKKAGYFESVERGRFKLNPVGYNLAAHNMPTGTIKRRQSAKKSKKKVSLKKKISKKGKK